MSTDPNHEIDALTRTCRDLIDIESVSRNEAAITDYIRRQLPDTARIVHDDDTVLAISLDEPGTPLTYLAGHTDTVPIAKAQFPSAIRDHTIYGRGACDMKGSLAVMLELAHRWPELRSECKVPDATGLGLLFFGREELPPAHNPLPTALHASQILTDMDLVVLMEPTANHLEVGCMGNLNLTLNYRGKAAHSARPWTGENAAHKAISELGDLKWSQQRVVKIKGYEYVEVSNVTGIRSGTARNVIPGSAEVDINVRFAWDQSSKSEREAKWIESFPEASVLVAGHASAAPPIDTPEVAERFLRCGALGAKAKQAWTNAADFAEVDIPVIHFGPGDPKLAHTDEESVTIDALNVAYGVLKDFLPGRAPIKSKNHLGDIR